MHVRLRYFSSEKPWTRYFTSFRSPLFNQNKCRLLRQPKGTFKVETKILYIFNTKFFTHNLWVIIKPSILLSTTKIHRDFIKKTIIVIRCIWVLYREKNLKHIRVKIDSETYFIVLIKHFKIDFDYNCSRLKVLT